MAEVLIRDVHKHFDATHVVKGVDVTVPDGSFTILVGPSGCGKSTLLRMIAGIEDVTAGEVRIGGEVVNDRSPTERDIAMVFQNYALYPHMTVAQNMSFALRIAGVAKAEIEARVARAAQMLALQPLLARLPRELSGGQRQRVAMGRALVRDPAVFLFDEPLSNLDAKLRVAMRAEIKALHQRLGTTTIYVTHDQIEAMTMGDTIVVMRDGLVEQSGTPLAVYDAPANVFVAGFIGSPAMNLLPGRLDGAGRFVSERGFIVALEPRHAALPAGEVVYGIRPEHLVPSDGTDGWRAAVQLVEPTGQQTQVTLDVAGHTLIAAFYERIPQGPGSAIGIAPLPGLCHLFDAASGRRIA